MVLFTFSGSDRRVGSGVLRLAAVGLVAGLTLLSPASATTLNEALGRAYETNPVLNAERARLRAVNESVTQAKAGYRPNVSAGADIGQTWTNTPLSNTTNNPRGYSVSVQQPLFRGFRTQNAVSGAEASVLSARQALADVEQNVLLDAVTAYMDVLNTRAIVALRERDVAALEEQLGGSRARFEVGELTRTDVAQAQARVSLSISQLTAARANQFAAEARYVQIIGREPHGLQRPMSVRGLLPPSLDAARQMALVNHPAILASEFAVAAADYQVKVIQGELLPSASVEASYGQRWGTGGQSGRTENMSITGRINVPIYEGGVAHSRTRQAKEELARSTLQTDIARRQVEATLVSAWQFLAATRQQIEANQSSLQAAQLALDGIREEFRVGQRSTIDVLDAQRDVLTAQVNLVQAQRDEVVAAFTLLAATGQMQIDSLRLPAQRYDAEVHYQQVKDRWFGVDVPDYQFQR